MNLRAVSLSHVSNLLKSNAIHYNLSDSLSGPNVLVRIKRRKQLLSVLLLDALKRRSRVELRVLWLWLDLRLFFFLVPLLAVLRKEQYRVSRCNPLIGENKKRLAYILVDMLYLHRNRLVAAYPEGRIQEIEASIFDHYQGQLLNRSELGIAESDSFDFDFKVDAVFTWVDSSDAHWQARFRQQTSGSADLYSSKDQARFNNRDELKYALRAIEMYGDFFHKIYIVTDRQKPAWLNSDYEKIVLIDHTEIFPDTQVLPTFNSHAIEACLHRIPGLSEHFVYFNDDVFLARPFTKADFFEANGLTKGFITRHCYQQPSMNKTGQYLPVLPVDAAGNNNCQLLQRTFGRSARLKLAHAPFPLLRSVLTEMEEVYQSEFNATRSNRFRSANDISVASSLFFYYAFLSKRAVRASHQTIYVDLSSRLMPVQLLLGLRREHDFFCLNETVHRKNMDFLPPWYLSKRFPFKSSYEK